MLNVTLTTSIEASLEKLERLQIFLVLQLVIKISLNHFS